MWPKMFLVKVGQRGSNTFYNALKSVVEGFIKMAFTPQTDTQLLQTEKAPITVIH